MAKKGLPESYNESVFEIRYKPNAKVLDFRGNWAEQISEHMQFSEWRIVSNRFDVYDKEIKHRCFVGFRNAGFECNGSPTANYFPEKAIKFFRFVLQLEEFGAPLFVERIGVRSKFYIAFGGSFEKLLERYSTRFLEMTEPAKLIMKARLTDIGGPLYFEDEHGKITTMSGPMISEQAEDFFNLGEDLPPIGLFFDIDYWLEPQEIVGNEKILNLVSTFAREAWEKHEKLAELIVVD